MPGYIHGTPQEADYDLKEALAEKARRAAEAAGYAKGGPVKGHDDESEDRKLFGKMIKEYESREDAKGKGAKTASYAAGGPVAGTTRKWFKEPDPFRAKESEQGKQDYSDKGGEKAQAKPKSETKQYKPRT